MGLILSLVGLRVLWFANEIQHHLQPPFVIYFLGSKAANFDNFLQTHIFQAFVIVFHDLIIKRFLQIKKEAKSFSKIWKSYFLDITSIVC